MTNSYRSQLAKAFRDMSKACEAIAVLMATGEPLPEASEAEPVRKPRAESKPTPLPVEPDPDGLTPVAVKLLRTLKSARRPLNLIQLSLYSDAPHTSSSFGKAIAELRRCGFVDGPGAALVSTHSGDRAAGDVLDLPERRQLFEMLCSRLQKSEYPSSEGMLRALYRLKMASLEDISAETGQPTTSSSFGKSIAHLRRMGLVTGPGKQLRLADDLHKALHEPTVGVFDHGTGKSVRVDAKSGHAKT